MKEYQTQKISIRLPLEDYGWVIRYGEKNDMNASQVIRKAVKTYRAFIQRKAQQAVKKEQE